MGSPPLTRELPATYLTFLDKYRITPAYAGITLFFVLISYRLEDHPRLRGNYHSNMMLQDLIEGSPPLTRELRSKTHGAL